DLGTDISAGFRFGWDAFRTNLAAVLVPGLVYFVLMWIVPIVLMVVLAVVGVGLSQDPGSGGEAAIGIAFALGYGLMMILMMVLVLLWTTGLYRIGAEVLAGRRPSIGQGFVGT